MCIVGPGGDCRILMGAQGSPGGESVALNRSRAMLDNKQNVQTRLHCSLRRGYRSASYSDIEKNPEYTLPLL
jgi:hypothetical protein